MIRDLTTLGVKCFHYGNELLCFNPREFFRRLHIYSDIDVLTYTYGVNPIKVRRLIFNIPCEVSAFNQAKQIRQNKNNHIKMFLCYDEKKLKAVWIGSLNCRLGINYNVMFSLPKKFHAECRSFYESVWSNSTYFCANKHSNADNVTVNQQKHKTQKHNGNT